MEKSIMDRNELLKQFNNYRSAAELKLQDASKAIVDGKFEDATRLQGEADELSTKAIAIQKQIERVDQMANMTVADTQKSEPVRLPFDTTETQKTSETPVEGDSFAKTAYVLKYGDINEAVKGVTKDLYGKDYYEKRVAQNRAFAKYLRYGFERVNASEYGLLGNLIYTPETIENEIKAGYTVQEINANKVDQQEASLELGGALAPASYQADLIKRLMGMTVVRGRARSIQTVRDSVEWPKLEGGNSLYTSGVRVTWVNAEIPGSATVAQTNATFGSIKIPAHVVMARLDVSRSLLEDSAIDVPGLVSELFSEAMAVDEDNMFLTGNGAGRPEGILGSRATGDDPAPITGVSVTNSGNATALTADGLIDLVYSLDAQYLASAVLIGRKAAFRDIRKLKDGNGDYLWQRGIERGAPPTVLGYDFFMNENMPAIAASAHPILFVDLRGYMITDRIGLSIERVSDVTTTGQNKVAFFARRRLGGQLIEAYRAAALKVSA
jgi:HK97 family phage major capsid protein